MKKKLLLIVMFLLCFAGISSAVDYSGEWMGSLNNQSFFIRLWVTNDEWNGQWVQDNVYENLVFLGYNQGQDTLYFYRRSDYSCFGVYSSNQMFFLSYYKKDLIERVMLMRR